MTAIVAPIVVEVGCGDSNKNGLGRSKSCYGVTSSSGSNIAMAVAAIGCGSSSLGRCWVWVLTAAKTALAW